MKTKFKMSVVKYIAISENCYTVWLIVENINNNLNYLSKEGPRAMTFPETFYKKL